MYDQNNMSGKNSAYAALISNISERDRAKNVDQFDDVLMTFVKETSQLENMFGKIRDEEISPLLRRRMKSMKKHLPKMKSWSVVVCEDEPWQEMIIRRVKQKIEEYRSCLSLESSSFKTIVEVKDRWVKARVTMDSGATAHVMLEGMFPLVNLERMTSPKKFVAGNGEQIRDLRVKTIPFKTHEGAQKMHNIQTIKLYVNKGVCALDMWMCLDGTGPVSSWQGQRVAKPLSTGLKDQQQCAEVKKQRSINVKMSKQQN